MAPVHQWVDGINKGDMKAATAACADQTSIIDDFRPHEWHIDITADRAYVVVPATYSYKEKGTLVKEPGSIWTLALKKDEAGWRITGWAWTAP
jgi:hypothetical protein